MKFTKHCGYSHALRIISVGFDFVMISVESLLEESTIECSRLRNTVLFEKMFGFVRVCKEFGERLSCSPHSRESFPIFDPDSSPEVCFVQWYETINKDYFLVDKIDKVMNVFGLSWHRSKDTKNGLDAEKMFGLVLVESIRGSVCDIEKEWNEI